MNTIKSAIIYTRVSSKGQSAFGTISLQVQEQKCREFCESKNIKVLKVYQDVRSGFDMTKLDGLQRAVRHLKRTNKNTMFVVYDVSRFSRNQTTGLSLLEQIRAKSRMVYSVLDTFLYDNNENNRFLWQQALDVAQKERERLIKKVNDSITFRIQRGDNFGNPGFGFKAVRMENDSRVFIQDVEEQEAIRDIILMNNDDRDCDYIANVMNTAEQLYRGSLWTASSVFYLINRTIRYLRTHNLTFGQTL